MNIQTLEPPREALAQALEADRTVAALKHKDETVNKVAKPAEAGGEDPKGQGRELTRDEARGLAEQAQQYFKEQGVNLRFRLLEESKEVQVEMVDADSHKVIRKIPQDEVVKLSDNLKRLAKGVMDKSV